MEAEREQGITIDVAYRYFSTARRSFVVADTPGHEQYTRNMATGASNSDLAILLVDARKGLLSQTRRHAIIASLLGIRYCVLAINKIDLVDFERTVFEQISASFNAFASELGFKDIKAIPMSARYGDNVSSHSERMPWYSGRPLLDHLETVDVEDKRADKPLRMPVQWVNRTGSEFRGFAATLASGGVKAGDEIVVLPSGKTTKVKTVIGPGGEVAAAWASDSVTVTLADEIDVARGDMFASARDRPQTADQFAAHLVWMSNEHLLPGRSYLMKANNSTLSATVTEIKHKLDINTLSKLAAKTFGPERGRRLVIWLLRCPSPFDAGVDKSAIPRVDRDRSPYSRMNRLRSGMIDFAQSRHQYPPPESYREQGRSACT